MGYKLTNNKTIVVDKIVVGTPVRTVQAAGIPGCKCYWGGRRRCFSL